MKKKVKLPTILGLLILLGSVIAGIFLINSKQEFKLSANIEAIPLNVRISNITDSEVTVSWTTEVASSGFIKWGYSENSLNKVVLETGDKKGLVHMVNISDIDSNSTIYFKINSNKKDYDNNGVVWQIKTLSQKVLNTNSVVASGIVLQQDGNIPAKAIVYLNINGIIVSAVTSDEGSYIIPVSNFTSQISDNTIVEISINAGSVGTTQATIYPKSMKSIPIMVLGKTYDFRQLPPTNDSDLPKSSLSIPESIEVSSRFEVQKVEGASTTAGFTIDSINDGEIITTTDPEFFGNGPKNSNIEISVESELQEGVVTTNSTGIWKWSPPNNLEQGEHKVTLKWRDASGILRTLTKTFVVQAAEGPAFESTPSATLTPRPLTTPTSSPVATIVSSPVATLEPTPETGNLLPTIGLFLMGIGILTSSIYVWNKSYVN